MAGVREEAYHGESNEGAHGAAVIISWEAAISGLEVGWDIEVRPLGREGGAAGVVVLEDGEESGLVADVGDLLIVEVVESVDEGCWSSKVGDESCLVVRYEA